MARKHQTDFATRAGRSRARFVDKFTPFIVPSGQLDKFPRRRACVRAAKWDSAEDVMSRFRLGSVLASVLLFSAPSAFGQNSAPVALVVGQSVSGELSPNDSQRHSGKYEDVFTVQGRRGGRLDLRLGSADF